jgi:hypothetical protein
MLNFYIQNLGSPLDRRPKIKKNGRFSLSTFIFNTVSGFFLEQFRFTGPSCSSHCRLFLLIFIISKSDDVHTLSLTLNFGSPHDRAHVCASTCVTCFMYG